MMDARAYGDEFVKALFTRMGPSYDVTNLVSSLGFSRFWRRLCVCNAGIRPGDRVCDMMSGGGECWEFLPSGLLSLVSIDFCEWMIARQEDKLAGVGCEVDVRCENAARTSLVAGSLDCVISAFGLKTLDRDALAGFAGEIFRILKPGGRFSLLEISTAEDWWLGPVYRAYLHRVIPRIGRLCLGDVECYRMLGAYTEGFGSCDRVAAVFQNAGLEVSVRRHFFGCATSLVGIRP